jgi:hypothetical protein
MDEQKLGEKNDISSPNRSYPEGTIMILDSAADIICIGLL